MSETRLQHRARVKSLAEMVRFGVQGIRYARPVQQAVRPGYRG